MRTHAVGAAMEVRGTAGQAKIEAMNAQRKRQRSIENVKQDERSSGVFLVAAAGRVARRGSTRLEPSTPAEHTSRGRGGSRHGDA